VVAEGVETTEQLDMVRNAGCHLVQGYLLGRPAPSAEWQRRPTIPGQRYPAVDPAPTTAE
jgi:EAL domain-containing protein (putative c-di-GMP-specific phosphodiesterase class I)